MRSLPRRPGLLLALALAFTPLVLAGGPKEKEPETKPFAGKVIPLADLAGRLGTKLDADAAATTLVLAGDDGKVYSLLKDEGSRLFFADPQLLKRPMRLTGRLLPGSQILQVLNVHSVVKGRLHDVYYWCDICSIKRHEKKICECCGGPMERREEPVKD